MSQFIPSFVIAYSNSDFTNPHEVVLPDDPKDCTADFTHMGVKYWGLETKRHIATQIDSAQKKITYQHNAHNWIKIAFKQRAAISSVRVNTKWFTGNQVRAISIIMIDELTGEEQEILTRVALQADQDHCFEFAPVIATECFIKIYYEGGISRINFFGEVAAQQLPQRKNLLEQASISHVSNEHYGHPKMAVSANRKELHMVGWESARTGFGEQAIFHLAQPTIIEEIVVDTYLHRLNPPLTCHVFGMLGNETKFEKALLSIPKWMLRFDCGREIVPSNFQEYMLRQSYLNEAAANPLQFEILLLEEKNAPWKAVLPFEVIHADTYHRFSTFKDTGPFSHLLYMHYPNGGIHALKLFGH